MKKAIAFISAALLILACGCSDGGKEDVFSLFEEKIEKKTTEYSNSDIGYSIKLPGDWELVEDKTGIMGMQRIAITYDSCDLFMNGDEDFAYIASMNIDSTDEEFYDSMEKWQDEEDDGDDSAEILSGKRCSVGGYAAYQKVIDHPSESEPVTCVMLYIHRKGNGGKILTVCCQYGSKKGLDYGEKFMENITFDGFSSSSVEEPEATEPTEPLEPVVYSGHAIGYTMTLPVGWDYVPNANTAGILVGGLSSSYENYDLFMSGDRDIAYIAANSADVSDEEFYDAVEGRAAEEQSESAERCSISGYSAFRETEKHGSKIHVEWYINKTGDSPKLIAVRLQYEDDGDSEKLAEEFIDGLVFD